MTEKIFDQMGAPAPSPAEASTEETTPAPSEMVEKSDDVPTATAEPSTNTVPTEDKATEPTSETVPTLEVEPSPELTIEGATEEAIADTAVLAPNEVKAGNKAPLKVPTYAELKQSELYMPIVDIDRLNDDQLVRAAQNKLAGDMDVRTFMYCWLHFAFRDNHDYAKQFLVKSKCLDKGIDYIKGKLKKVSNGAVGIGEGKVIELFLEYLRLDDAYIAAEKAKEEAARKKKAEAARAKAKEKKSKKTESKPSASAKAKSDKAAEKKPSTKKKASKAATEESVLSLFSMM